MARTALAVQEAVLTGLTPTFSAATADGHAISNPDEKVAIYVKNASASPITVTIATPATVSGLAITDLTVSVPAAGERLIGPFPKGLFNQDDSGVSGVEEAVFLNTSAQASVTYAALKVG